MRQKIGNLILITYISVAPVKVLAVTSEIHIKSDDALFAMWTMPTVQRHEHFVTTLNRKFWKMMNFSKPCLTFEEKRLCASVQGPDEFKTMIVVSWNF